MRKQRLKKVRISDHLVGLFKNATAAQEAMRANPRMSADEAQQCGMAIYKFEKSVDYMPWERSPSPLDWDAEGHWAELRKALLKAIDAKDGRAA